MVGIELFFKESLLKWHKYYDKRKEEENENSFIEVIEIFIKHYVYKSLVRKNLFLLHPHLLVFDSIMWLL